MCPPINYSETAKWARWDSNPRPRDYESPALTAELQARATAKLTILPVFTNQCFVLLSRRGEAN